MRACRKTQAGGWFWHGVEYLTPFRRFANPQAELISHGEISAESPGVLIELVRLHARALKRLPIAQSLVVIGLAAVVYPHVPAAMFLGWSMLTLGIESLRAVYAESVLRRGDRIEPRCVHRRFVVLAAVAGAAVGLSAACFMPRLPIIGQALIAIILFAMPAAGVTVAVSSKYILAVYALGILVPTAASWAAIHPPHQLPVGGLTALYWGFMISVAADGEKLLLKSVLLRHQRDRMVKELEQRNAEVRAAVDRAEQSAQSRARVLAAASHDLRQPLHALSVYSAILSAHPAAENLPEIAHNIERIVSSLGGLLNGLLDLSSLSIGEYMPDKRVFSLDQAAFEVCAEYESAAADKKLVLVLDLLPVQLYGDSIAVTRILRNLLDNAIKYTEQGEIKVETRRDGSAAILIIADSGIGIPADEQTRVFEEFYQLDNPGRNRSKGVGLGLAIVQRLCELTEARLSLTSEPGLGTRWELRFPSALAEQVDFDGAVESSGHQSLQGLRVYIVDDEGDILDGMHALFDLWRISVETAHSAAKLEELFHRFGKPDLLVADLRLAGAEHGVALAKRLQGSFGHFEVLIMTGEIASGRIGAVAECRFPLLQKPISPKVLYDELQKIATSLAGNEC